LLWYSSSIADAEDSDDDLLVPRHKTQDELDLEEEEYREFLTRAVGEDIGGLVEVEREDGWLARGAAVDEEPVTKKKGKKERKKEKETAGKTNGKRDDDADQKFLLECVSCCSRIVAPLDFHLALLRIESTSFRALFLFPTTC